MDDASRVASRRVGPDIFNAQKPAVRYELGDHLGSSSVVVSETGGLISREEYRPYGESSFGSYAKKRFRFTGKERDEESGLYYHGARYYSPWLCRWTAPDPAGMVDGVNVYAYVRGNPVRLVDPGGMEGEDTSQPACPPVEGSDVDLAIRARDGKGYPNTGYRGLDVPNVAADQVQRDIEQDDFRARSGEVSSREPDIVDVGNSLFEVGVGLGLGGLRSLEEAWNGTLGNPGHHETPESRVREPETPEEELGDVLSIFFPIGIRGGRSPSNDGGSLRITPHQRREWDRRRSRHTRNTENVERFSTLNEARDSASHFAGLGDDAIPYLAEAGPYDGIVYTGMQSPDTLRGWRIDWDPDTQSAHVNWWNKSSKKRGSSNWSYGANVIDGMTYEGYLDVVEHFPRKTHLLP